MAEHVPGGMNSWKPAGAALVGPQGESLRVLEVWPLEPIAPGDAGTLVVELEATEREVKGPFILKAWSAEGVVGGLTLGGVMFP
jgi:hypothetical protein